MFLSTNQVEFKPKVLPYYFQQEKRHVMHLVCNVKSTSKTPEASAKVPLLFHDCVAVCVIQTVKVEIKEVGLNS